MAAGEGVVGEGLGAGECAAAAGFGAVECPGVALPQPAANAASKANTPARRARVTIMAGPFEGRTGRRALTSRTAMGTARFERERPGFVVIRAWSAQGVRARAMESLAGRAARARSRQAGPACPAVPGSSLAVAPAEPP